MGFISFKKLSCTTLCTKLYFYRLKSIPKRSRPRDHYNMSASKQTYFLMMNRRTRQMESIRAAMIGPMTQTIPASSVLRLTLTSEMSVRMLGLGRRGGSPGGTSLISRASSSENGLDVNRCCTYKYEIRVFYTLEIINKRMT